MFFYYRNKINAAILQLTENGELAKLENKWWLEECGYESKVSDMKLILRYILNMYMTLG